MLVLWDVDHTLVDSGGVAGQLHRLAFEAVTGRGSDHDVPGFGRTERAILAEALRRYEIAFTERLMAAYVHELPRQYERRADLLRERGRALPGAAGAVRALAAHHGVIQAVLTGNLRAVAGIKLRVFGLDQHIDWDVGAYGDDHANRAALVPLAQQRAGAKYAATFTVANTVIIGDTVADVRAAHLGGAKIVAVATGHDNVTELRRAGATVVLADLTDERRLVESVLRS